MNEKLDLQIINMYNNNGSTRSIAKEIQMSQSFVSKVIKKYNISRNLSEARKTASNENRVSYNDIVRNLPTIPWNSGKTGLQISTRKGKHYAQISGKNHWNWKGGKSTIQHKRYTLEGKKWTKYILDKYDYTCQVCGKRGCVLNAHHIKSFIDNESLRYDTNNGIVLCVKHHRLVHKIIIKLEKQEELLEHPKDQIATVQFERIIAIAKKAFDIHGQSAADSIRNNGKVQRLEDESRTDNNSSKSILQLKNSTEDIV